MVYSRDSRRTSSTGDVINADTFRELGRSSARPAAGQDVTCALQDSNADGLPDYYIYTPPTGNIDIQLINYLLGFPTGSYNYSAIAGTFNQALPMDYQQSLLQSMSEGNSLGHAPPGDRVGFSPLTKPGFLTSTGGPGALSYYQDRTNPAIRHYILYAPASNASTCLAANGGLNSGGTIYPLDINGDPIIQSRDGAIDGFGQFGSGTGVIDGTPTAVITNSLIDQSTVGGAAQVNWNLDKHKLMVGISMDRASASYDGKQRFGLLDNSRNVYSDPASIGAEYYAADHDVTINEFDGSSLTKSIYMSETWSPIDTLNFAFSSRYNYTDIENNLSPARRTYSLASGGLINKYAFAALCTNGVCPFDLSKPLTPEDYAKFIGDGGAYDALSAKQKEKFSYHSLNPSVGVTWQATPRLNLYTNWNQGTRVPSVIELGCAYEGQLVRSGTDNLGNPVYKPQSVAAGRQCSLPSAMSGDPYLPQVVAQTFEVGARGKFKDLLEWNISAYQTNLKDDIYLVASTPELSYFQDVGRTRRRGIEFGLAGEYGKSDFRVNYSLTEATFQSAFKTLSPNNSSTINNVLNTPLYNNIQVNPGDVMPGIPLNNLNFSWGYKLTPALKINLGMVAHSGSFLRGNENNEHTPGPGKGIVITQQDPLTGLDVARTIPTPDYRYEGRAPGYAVLNFRTTYDLGKGWMLGAMVNNLLDKKYYSAGRLGINPFSPSINGAIGAGGFNYNSSEWQSTQFISAGAPRGVWFTLSYDFDASKKSLPPPSNISMTEPDRTIGPLIPQLSQEELAIQAAVANSKALPVLKRNLAGTTNATLVAEQEVTAAIQGWNSALANSDAAAYLQNYAPSFSAEGLNRKDWEEQRKLQIAIAGKPSVEISDLLIAPQGKRMTAFFTQTYRSENRQETANKILYLEQQDGRWLIIREQGSPIAQPLQKSEIMQHKQSSALGAVIPIPVKSSIYAEVR
jgi:outer membrane receptor protein involved in Fe transport/ketosteroid isomerase-like protein